MNNNKLYPTGYPPNYTTTYVSQVPFQGETSQPAQQQYIQNPSPSTCIPQVSVQQQYIQNPSSYISQVPIQQSLTYTINPSTPYVINSSPLTTTTTYAINPPQPIHQYQIATPPNYTSTYYYSQPNPNVTYQTPIISQPGYTTIQYNTNPNQIPQPIYYAYPQTTIYSTPIDYVKTTTTTTYT